MLSPAYPQFQKHLRGWCLAAAVLWAVYGGLQLTIAVLVSEGYSLGGLVVGQTGAELARLSQGTLGAGLLASGLLLLVGFRPAAYPGVVFGCCTMLLAFVASLQLIDRGGSAAWGLLWVKMALPLLVGSFGIVLALYLHDDRRFHRQQFADVTLAAAGQPAGGALVFPCPRCGVGLAAGALRPAELVVCPACLKAFTGGVALRPGAGARAGRAQCVCEQVMRARSDQGGASTVAVADTVLARRWDLPPRPPGSRLSTECPYCAHALEIAFFAEKPAETTGKGPIAPGWIPKDVGSAGTPSRPALVNVVRGILGGKKEVFFVRHKIAFPEKPDRASAAAPVRKAVAPQPGPAPAVRVSCPSCGAGLKVPAQAAGKVFRCPRCRGAVATAAG